MSDDQAMRELVTKDELSELLTGERSSEADDAAEPHFAENNTKGQLELVMQYWENSIRELQKEVRELKAQVEKLERHQRRTVIELRTLSQESAGKAGFQEETANDDRDKLRNTDHSDKKEKSAVPPLEKPLSRAEKFGTGKGRWF